MKTKMKTNHALCGLISGLLLLAAGTHTAHGSVIVNGSFETGDFTGWTTTGATSIQGSGFTAPTNGSFQALATSGTGSVSAASLAAFFGVGSLPGNGNGAATEGSGFKQSFTLASASTLSFDYKLVTNEAVGSGFDEIMYFDGSTNLLGSANNAISGQGAAGFINGTPYATVTLNLSAGTHTIGFAAYDTGDTVVDSGIVIDNVSLEAVPEPGTALFGFACVGVAALRRRRRSAV